MKVELDRYDLKILVLGSSPPISHWMKYECLRWYGLDPMTWSWNERRIADLSDDDLWKLFKDIKEA